MKLTESALRQLIRQVIREANESDKYTHIGYGKYREKGKEKDKDAETFKKTDSGKFEPFGDKEGGEKDKPEPKQTKIAADPFADKDSETGKDYTKKFTGTDEPKEFDNEFEQLSQAYLDADDHMAQNDFVEDFINQYKDSDLSDEEQEMYDDLKTAYEDGDNEGMDMVLGAYEDEWEESITPELKREFKQYGFTKKAKNWR